MLVDHRHPSPRCCHSPFDGSHPSPERIQGTHLVSQSPTLKWVAGGVWDEFQKRMPLLWAWSGSIHGMHFFAAQWVASISFWRVHDGLAVLDALLCWGFGLYAVVARRPAHRLWVVSFSARSWLTLLAAHYWRLLITLIHLGGAALR